MKSFVMAAAIILAAILPSKADLLPADDDPVIFLRYLNEIIASHGLSDAEYSVIKQGSASWYFAWPCRGDTTQLKAPDMGLHAAAILARVHPSNAFEMALLSAIGVWVVKDQGRPTPANCALALVTAGRKNR